LDSENIDEEELVFSFLSLLSTRQKENFKQRNTRSVLNRKELIQSQVKVVLIGEGAVGKTTLRLKFMGEQSTHGLYISTLGADFSLKYIDIPEENHHIMLQIWDVAGQSRFKEIVSSYYAGANGALVVYDLTQMHTFDQLKYWLDHLFSITGPIPFVILGNKLDIAPTNQIFEDIITEADATIKKLNKIVKSEYGFECHHFLTSAITGENVNSAFSLLTKEIFKTLYSS
jgi:small GTP-binding protein